MKRACGWVIYGAKYGAMFGTLYQVITGVEYEWIFEVDIVNHLVAGIINGKN